MQTTNNIYNFTIQFTDDQKESILSAAGGLLDPDRKNEFFSCLAEIAYDCVFDKWHNQQPTPSKLGREFEKISRAVKRIKKVLESGQDVYEINNYLLYGIYKCLCKNQPAKIKSEPAEAIYKRREIKQNLNFLEKSLESTLEILKSNKEVKTADDLIRSLYYRLGIVYLEYFGKKPRTSVGGPLSAEPRKPGGPLIRFIKKYFEAVRASIPPEFASSYPDIIKQFSVKDDAIRHRIRQIDFPKIGL